MKIDNVKIKMLEKIENENDFLLNICNDIEIYLNYKTNYDYLERKNNQKSILFLENIKVLNESTFNFDYCLKMNNKENYIKEFSYLYKYSNNLNKELKEIIIFHKKFIKDNKLLKKINNLNLGNKIENIERFYYIPFYLKK